MQIQRAGRISFGDASLSIWEEGISAARAAGGFKGEEEWTRLFKRQVFARIIQQMNRIGWKVGPWDEAERYKPIANDRRTCSKGDHLHAHLEITGRCINLEMWQSANTPTRPDHQGRYESNKEAIAPYLLRLEFERTRRKIRDYLCNVFTDYEFCTKHSRGMRKVGPGKLTAMEYALLDSRESGHYREELGRANFTHDAQVSGDGMTIEHGSQVYAYGYDRRIITGIAMYCLNGNWKIISGKYGITHNVWHKQVFVKSPGDLRRKRNDDIRRKRLEGQLNKAIAAMNFDRAKVLRDIIYPPGEPIFCLWHSQHEAYHCAGFSGYTKDQMQAGKFTRTELEGWGDDRNVIVPFGARAA